MIEPESCVGVRAAVRRETLLPLYVNVFAGALADLGGLAPLYYAVREADSGLCRPVALLPDTASAGQVRALLTGSQARAVRGCRTARGPRTRTGREPG
ncbi:hypothetical protein [Streptomyces sp. S.PNR 29]|uniref:hypothetical protein n=1 Tax=Streptomyces sp. S.PNR 29 TaxID=2973805 RepID=UPI0025B180FF|nr:hypothetical protein [Streptomyces sp. S.PNR 29]MDN0196333.1 hypothetical protein [Streptomyces sp. S.PNR 29]